MDLKIGKYILAIWYKVLQENIDEKQQINYTNETRDVRSFESDTNHKIFNKSSKLAK